MGLFGKKKAEAQVLPTVPKASGGKKVSIFDIHQQAFHEITVEEYHGHLRALGLSDAEASAKVKEIGG